MTITIITATWNAEKTITKLLNSIESQECFPQQFVVVDNCSTDRTVELVRSFENRFRMRGISLDLIIEKDNGIYDALNKGLKIATGDWINIIGADDFYLPEAFCKVMNSKEILSYDVLYANIQVIDSLGNIYFAKPRLDIDSVSRGMFLFHPAMFARRDTYQKVGIFANYRLSADYDWIYRAVKARSKFLYIDTYPVRHFSGGISSRHRHLGLAENNKIRMRMGVPAHFRILYYLREKYLSPKKRWFIELFNDPLDGV